MPYTDDEEIHALLNFNPPSIKASPVTTKSDAPALSFYDKHLSPNLALKRVAHLPTLLLDMTKALNACMDIIDAQAITIPPISRGDRFRTIRQRKVVRVDDEATDAPSIAKLYRATTGENCQTVASTLVLTPHCSSWLPTIFFERVDVDVEDNPTDQTFSLEEYSLGLPSNSKGLSLHPKIKECLSQSNLELLQRLFKRDRRLSTWEFLPYTSQAIDVIQNLCGGKSRRRKATPFDMRVPQPIGDFQSPDVAMPLDAEVTPWYPQNLTRNLRPRKTSSLPKSTLPKTTHCPPVEFHIASPPSKNLLTIVNDVLQHAWVTACRRDSTFIVFQCGNYERIGVRHRATQTLYLSDLIDVPNVTDPGSYTELHLNLYVLILRDALQRAAYLGPQDDVPPLPRKRRREESEVLAREQRRKLRSYVNHSGDEVVADVATSELYGDIRSRHLLLVSLQYGVYSSPNPATFFRPGHHPNISGSRRVAYTATEYILIRLTSLITRGGTGTVHGGRLEAHCKDGLVTRDIVAKLAFGSDQKQRMLHEATIYEHLTKSGVSCIPICYGIFEEPHDDGPSVLVTSHEGYCLQHWNREYADIGVPKIWRNKFLQAMKGIHDAGVCHRDIRPENLVVNASGDVCIIDFDRADLTSSIGARKREYEHLRDLLEGNYTPPGYFPSRSTVYSDKQ